MSNQKSNTTARSITVRFGDAVLQEGHTAVPNLVLKHYAELGITPTEMMFIIHVWQFWWTERQPFPSLSTIARRMNITRRQGRKHTQSLKEKGLLEVHDRFSPTFGQMSSEYDFTPLIRAVVALSQEADRDAMAPPPRNNSSEGGRNYRSQAPRNDSSPEEDLRIKKIQNEKDFENSNIRKAPSVKSSDSGTHMAVASSAEETAPPAGMASVGEVLKHRGERSSRPRPETETEEWQAIQSYIDDFARQLGDTAPLKSSATRAYHLFQASGLPLDAFLNKLFQARALTQESTARITKTAPDAEYGVKRKTKMAYFFAVLEDQLGLLPPEEKARRDKLHAQATARYQRQQAKGKGAQPPAKEQAGAERSEERRRDSDDPYAAYIEH